MVSSNECLFGVELCANVLKDLILEFCPIITKEDTRSRVGADEVKDKGMSHCRSRLIR